MIARSWLRSLLSSASLAAILSLLAFSGTAEAQITNGSFETGDYSGWILHESPAPVSFGTWGIATDGQTIAPGEATFDYFDGVLVSQLSPGLPITFASTHGSYVAYQLQTGGQFHRMYQDVLVPSVATSLLWDMRYFNHFVSFTSSQELHVAVRDTSTNALLATLFRTIPGVSPLSSPMTTYCADISAFAGQVVRLSFEHQVQSFYFDLVLDNIRFDQTIMAADRLGFGVPPSATEKQTQTWNPIGVCILDEHGHTVSTSGNVVTLSLVQGTGTLSGTLSKAAITGVVTFDDLSYDKAETIRIDVSSPGLTGIFGTQIIVQPFVTDLRVRTEDITLTPTAPAVGELTTIQARVVNAGGEPAPGQVRFYRGDPDFGGTLIGTTPVQSLPVGGQALFSVPWTPMTDGLQSIFALVDNLSPSMGEATPQDNRASRQVSVGAAAEELSVAAGERIAWPGAQSTVPITVTNIGFGPATITGASFGPPGWLSAVTTLVGTTLQPGESLLALTQLDVPPGTPGGPLNGTPLVQPVPIALDTASGTFAGNLIVKVFDQAATNVTVQVVDDDTGTPLANALVAAQELPGNFVTDGSGQVTIQVPPGPNSLFAYRTGYVAQAGSFSIPEGNSTVELRLAPGQTLGVQQVVSEPLTTQEILDRGIEVNDPMNNAVYDFTIALLVGPPITLHSIELPRVPPTSGSDVFVAEGSTIQLPTSQGISYPSTPIIIGRFDYNAWGRTETWIIIPGEIWVLKQFFEVTTFVVNNANAPQPEDVQLVDVMASLNLPGGLGLPDLGGVPQELTQSLGTLNAQESTQATWVVRGDAAGTYQLNGLVTGDLFAFGNFQVSLSADATSEPFQVTLPRIRCEFFTPQDVFTDLPFTIGVLVTNESSARSNLVRVILEEQDLTNCTLENTEALQAPEVSFTYDSVTGDVLSATYTIGDLEPGTSGLAEFQLISEVTGTILRREIENGCGAAPSPSIEAIPQPPQIVDQPDPVASCVGSVATFQVTADGFAPITYQWRKDGNEIPGATDFVLYVDPVTLADGGTYDVVVHNPGGTTTSAGAILTVLTPPTVDLQPVSQAVCEGTGQVDFVVSASGPEPLTLQWRKDGVAIPGANGPTYSVAAPTLTEAGLYDVLVTSPCGSTASLAATLTIHVAPTIEVQPTGATLSQGATAHISVVASGTPAPGFQWRKDGVELAGETGATLTIADVTSADAGSYDVVVSNACGSETSAAATLIVNSPPVIDCNGAITLWSPDHELVDVGSAFGVSDPDGDPVSLSIRVFSDETEIPDTGDGTGKHAPDFKNELGGRGLLVRSERRGPSPGDGRWYVAVITADDGRGGVASTACLIAVCPHDQSPESQNLVLAAGSAAAGMIQDAIDQALPLPLAGSSEHGLSGQLGPKQ